MKSKNISFFLALVLLLSVFVNTSYSADPLGTIMHKKFCNNSGWDAYDLKVFFNGSVIVPGGVSGDYSPFTTVTNEGTNTVKFKDPTAPLGGDGQCTGCITFKSAMDDLAIDSAYWTQENGDKLADLNLSTDVKPCSPAKTPSLTFLGLMILTILVIASGIWLMRRRTITA